MNTQSLNRFKIEDSYPDPVEADTFVFEGKVIEGGAKIGMTFQVPEAGHMWTLLIKSIRFIPRAGAGLLLGLEVKNGAPGYPPGLGAGWTAELHEE